MSDYDIMETFNSYRCYIDAKVTSKLDCNEFENYKTDLSHYLDGEKDSLKTWVLGLIVDMNDAIEDLKKQLMIDKLVISELENKLK